MDQTPQNRSERLTNGDPGDLASQSEDQLREAARDLDIDDRALPDRDALMRAIRARMADRER